MAEPVVPESAESAESAVGVNAANAVHAATPPEDAPPSHPGWVRGLLLLALLAIIAGAVYMYLFSEHGRQLREHPHAAGHAFRHWVDGHPVAAPLILLVLYIAASISMMPVWWLQILAGYGFGLWLGATYSIVGAAVGALHSYGASRLLLAEYVQRKFEARHAKLREIDEKMGHNGLLVVMAARLTHVLPFGISNYLFGVTRITPMDVLLGTVLGNAPMITFYVAVGAGLHPLRNFWFMGILATVNLLLLVPIALRYWKPDWFKRIGVE